MAKIIIRTEQHRSRAMSAVEQAPLNFEVIVQEHKPSRSLDQNAKFHAMLGDISKQVEWHGSLFNTQIWNRLVTAAYLRECGEIALLVPALDNAGIDIIYEKTSKMSVKKMAELIEYSYAFGSQNDVVWSEKYMGEKS